MQLRTLEEVDKMRSFPAMYSDENSEQDEWIDEEEPSSCKICQTFLRMKYLKNLYKTKFTQLQEDSEQMIRMLTQSFDEAQNNFKILLEEKMESSRDLQSYEPYIKLVGQYSKLLSENANLQLGMKQLSQLLESVNDEHEKERSHWQTVINEQAKNIEILNDNIYYFINKLKFKRNAYGVKKRVQFKRNIKNVLSSRARNVKLLMEKLESCDRGNTSYYFCIKNKMAQQGASSEFEATPAAPTNTFNSVSKTLRPLILKNIESLKVECLHKAILDQPLEEDTCSENGESSINYLQINNQACSDNEVSCICENSDLGDFEENLETTTLNWDNGNVQNITTGLKKNNRTKYSIICQQSNDAYDSSSKKNLLSMSNGDAKFFFPKAVTATLKKSPETNNEAKFCDCNHYSIMSQNKDEFDEECSSVEASTWDGSFSERSRSETISPSVSSESSRISQTEQMHLKQSVSIKTLVDKSDTCKSNQTLGETTQRVGILGITDEIVTDMVTNSPDRTPSNLSKASSHHLLHGRLCHLLPQHDIQDPSPFLDLNVSLREQRIMQNSTQSSKGKSIPDTQTELDTLPDEIFHRLPIDVQHGLGHGLSNRLQRTPNYLPTVQEAGDSENGSNASPCHSKNQMHSSYESSQLGLRNECNLNEQITDSQNPKTLQPNLSSQSSNQTQNRSTQVPVKKIGTGFGDERAIESLLAFTGFEVINDLDDSSEEIQELCNFPLRTESAPGRLQAISCEFVP